MPRPQIDVTCRLGVFAGEAIARGSRAVVQIIDTIRVVGFGKDDVAVGVGDLAAHGAQSVGEEDGLLMHMP